MKHYLLKFFAAGLVCGSVSASVAEDIYRQIMPLPRGIVPAAGGERVPVSLLRSPEVIFGEVSGPVDGDIGCGVGAVQKTAPGVVADQAYRIDIAPGGVKVIAGGRAGERYARVTLEQLARLSEGDCVPAGTIIDWPALKWRGIMNDCGRNFLELEGVKAIIDLAARYKLNLFHWHLTEYHGWRLESKRYPNLTGPETMLRQIGKFYTQEDFKAVVAYAAERGVTVVPELDVPGHSLALRKGLGVDTMDSPLVERAVSELIDELCTLAPKEIMPFIHLGTDEVRVKAERVDAAQCSRWAEVVAKNGRVAVGWAPGEKMTSSGEIVDMVWEGGHPTNSAHRCFDAADFYFGSLGPQLILNRAQFAKPCDWDTANERKLGAIACCWHDDNVGGDTMRLFKNTVFAPALVAFSDNFWLGRPRSSPQYFTRLPSRGSLALGYTKYLENRLIAQRDKVLKDCPLPFAYVRQLQYRWRVSDGEGRVLDGCSPGGLFDVNSFVTNRTGLVVAETWVESPKDQTVGAWIDFMETGSTLVRSFNRPRPKLGEWSPLGSTVEINGEKIAPPVWKRPGLHANFDKLPRDGRCWLYRGVPYSDEVCETPIDDEWHFVREPTPVRLRKGWNHVRLTMPKVVDAPEPVWRGVFQLLEGTSERPREVPGLRFSSDPQPEGAVPLDVQGMLDRAKPGETVRIPAGRWQAKPFRLKSDVILSLDEGAEVYASADIRDYSPVAGQRYFIGAVGVTNAAIVGKGVFDGCGQQFNFKETLAGESQPRKLPVMMRFIRCRNLRLEGFTYRNGGAWGCHLCNCDGVIVRGVTAFNHSNRTNDGIDIESSNVLIEDCDIDADDDAIVLKSETDVDFPVTNVVIRNCRLASGCNAFKFGTGSYNAFRDVLLENCSFEPPKGNFVRGIRTPDTGDWDLTGLAGMALEVCDGGSMENVTVRNVTIRGYLTPVFVRLERRHEPPAGRRTFLRNVLIENVRGRAESAIASSITGVPGLRPGGIVLRNCDFTMPGGGTAADAAMMVAEKEKSYPDCTMFDNRRLPAWGFYIRHADDVRFEDVKLRLSGPDARPRIVTDDCSGFVETVGGKVVCRCADTGICVLPAGECDSVGRALVTPLADVISRRYRVVRQDAWYGGRRTVFDFEGYEAWVVEPPEGVAPAEGKPWTWTMQWKTAFVPRTGVPELLKRGWHHVTVDTFRHRMDAEGLRISAAFQKYLVEELGFSSEAGLIGLSWGGFFSTRYAAAYPQNVGKIYLDCPLLNFGCRRSTEGLGSWERKALESWTKDPRMPINMVSPIAEAKIPVLLVYGGADDVLNPKLSAEIFISRFKAAGGDIKVVYRARYGHHPHGFEVGESTVADFMTGN